MQNVKTRVFIKRLQKNGFVIDRQSGSHLIFVRDNQTLSIPGTNVELNGCLAKRLVKEFNLK